MNIPGWRPPQLLGATAFGDIQGIEGFSVDRFLPERRRCGTSTSSRNCTLPLPLREDLLNIKINQITPTIAPGISGSKLSTSMSRKHRTPADRTQLAWKVIPSLSIRPVRLIGAFRVLSSASSLL